MPKAKLQKVWLFFHLVKHLKEWDKLVEQCILSLLTHWHTLQNLSNLFLLELIKKSLSFEVVWNIVIKSGNNFVDLFLPTWIQILAKLNWFEKFAESLFHHPSKTAGYLLRQKLESTFFLKKLRRKIFVSIFVSFSRRIRQFPASWKKIFF